MLLAQPEENKRSANKACVASIRPTNCPPELARAAFPGVVAAMPSGLDHVAAEQIADRALPAARRVLARRSHSRRAPLRRPFSKRPLTSAGSSAFSQRSVPIRWARPQG